MAFNEQEKQIILFGKQQGKSRAEVEEALYRFRTGRPYTTEQPQQEEAQVTPGSMIRDAAAAGVQKIQEGIAPQDTQPSLVESAERGLKVAAGAAEVAASPFAPIFSPLGKIIGYLSDKIAENKAVQDFARSPAGEVTSRVAEDVMNASTVAGTIAGVRTAPKVGSAVADTAGEIAASVQALTRQAEGNIDNVVRSYEKGVKPLINANATPAKRAAYKDDVVTAVKTIHENKPNLRFRNEDGEELVGTNPETLQQFADSIEQTKKTVFARYDSLAKQAGEAGAQLDMAPIAKELDAVITNKALQLTNPRAIQYAKDQQARYLDTARLDTVTAQEVIQNYNNSLQAFYRNPSYETASIAAVDALIVNRLRSALDETISGLTGESYKGIKSQYAALKSIERDVMKAALRDARKNTKGLIDYTDIFSGGQVVSGILSLNPGTIASGITQKAIAEFYKYLNNPNRAIKQMFEEVERTPQTP